MKTTPSLRIRPGLAAKLLPATLLLGSLSLASTALAKPERYALDPVHTRVAFQVSHAGFSNPIGSFAGVTGTLEFDEQDWSTARLETRIPIASLDLGDADWQQKILDRTFFDAGKFAEARFVSTRVQATNAHSAQVTGDLTLHGVTHPVTLEVTLNAVARHPLTLRRTAGFSAVGRVSRKQFGIDAWPSLVGDEVRLIIEVEAVRERKGEQEPDRADSQ